jgi:hypothetical protein
VKTVRRLFPRSAQAHHRTAGGGDGSLLESKNVARAQGVVAMIDQARGQPENAYAFSNPAGNASGKRARKPMPAAIDLGKLLHFSQQLYAHALTLQEVIRNEGEVKYEVLRPRCERQAAQQFEIFYHLSSREK